MTSQLSKRLGRRLATITAVAALAVGAGTATAAAAEISVTPSSGLPATEASVLSVTGGGFEAAGKYRAGLCSTETYGIFGIPACGAMVEVTADGSGAIEAGLEVEKTTFNVHSELMFPLGIGQPEFFTCAGDSASEDECEIWVVRHAETQVVEATAPVSFE